MFYNIERLHDAVMMCEESGKKPVRAFVSFEMYQYIAELFGTVVRYDMLGITMNTPSGQLLVIARASLFEHVVVESEDGEPFIA